MKLKYIKYTMQFLKILKKFYLINDVELQKMSKTVYRLYYPV